MLAKYFIIISPINLSYGIKVSFRRLIEQPKFQKSQRSEDRFSCYTTDQRLSHNSEVIGSIDLSFGMKGCFRRLIEPPKFQKSQRSEDRFSCYTTDQRLSHNSEVIRAIDLSFGMKGCFRWLIKPLRFQKSERTDLAAIPQIRGCHIAQRLMGLWNYPLA